MTGPAARNEYRYSAGTDDERYERSSMLTIVIEKPIEVTIVSADPVRPSGACLATRAENWGESPTTVIPQRSMSARNHPSASPKKKEEKRQHAAETESGPHATFALPRRAERNPPAAHPILPAAMTANDQNEALMPVPPVRYAASTRGRKA